MARVKLLSLLTCGGISIKSSHHRAKNNVGGIAPQSDEYHESEIIKRHEEEEELFILLSKFPDPDPESKSDRELSFSFLLNNSPSKKDDMSEKGSKADDDQYCKETVAVGKEKRKRRSGSYRSGSGRRNIGVLLNFHVPVPLPDARRSRSSREMPCTTLAEIEKREMEFSKLGCWSALL